MNTKQISFGQRIFCREKAFYGYRAEMLLTDGVDSPTTPHSSSVAFSELLLV